MENLVKITVDGNELEIDLERAKKLGLCKEIKPKIESINIGDIFKNKWGVFVLIIQAVYDNYHGHRYNIAGLNGLEIFSDFHKNPPNEKEILKDLNGGEYIFIKNINDEIAKLIKE